MKNTDPAFPTPTIVYDGDGNPSDGTSPGLTKREYFAGQAMDATLARFFDIHTKDGDAKWIPFAARMCFEIADAMLAAAEPKTEEPKS